MADMVDQNPVDIAEPQVLRSLLIAFQGGQAILPNSAVVEVLPFAPSLGIENAPRWVIGAMLWKALTIPLVSLERLIVTENASETGHYTRIIIVHALGNHPRLRYFGLLGSEAPRIIELERSGISLEINLDPLPTGVLNRVLVYGQSAVIPDMDAIESILNRVMHN
jgi:chemosensory pili system protein ChpC